MPWTAKTFRMNHCHALTGAQANRAATVANAVLSRTGDEGYAVRAGIQAGKGRIRPRKKGK